MTNRDDRYHEQNADSTPALTLHGYRSGEWGGEWPAKLAMVAGVAGVLALIALNVALVVVDDPQIRVVLNTLFAVIAVIVVVAMIVVNRRERCSK